MIQQLRKQQFYFQLNLGQQALKNKDTKTSFYHFENAHDLGQKHVFRHTLSHFHMFAFGLKTNNYKESIGQVFRIITSILFTVIWVPKGNTGGIDISPVKQIPIRKELLKYFLK